MQVFLTDKNLKISATELDDVRLNKQITEINQIILACLNQENAKSENRVIKIGHINHPVTEWYNSREALMFLVDYQYYLCFEYEGRHSKTHMGYYTLRGLQTYAEMFPIRNPKFDVVYIKGRKGVDQIITTKNVYERYRNLLIDKWNNAIKEPKWTNRRKPEWYKK